MSPSCGFDFTRISLVPQAQGMALQRAIGGQPATAPPAGRLQRKCAECEEDEKKNLQRSKDGRGEEGALGTQRAVEVTRGGGEPLPSAVRSHFEPRFGHDFSKVRIHRSTEAAAAARGVQARAYTIGSDIVFGDGQYAPSTAEGQRLLAHELTHVVQQGGAASIGGGTLQRDTAPEAAAPSASDRELDDVIRVLEGRVSSASTGQDGASPAGTLHALRNVRASGTESQKAAVIAKIHEAAEQQKAKTTAAGGAPVAEPGETQREMQRKGVEVSTPEDPLEREADRVAASIVDGGESAGAITAIGPGSAQAKLIQRQAEAGALVLVEAGPIGWVILGAIVVGVGIYAATRTCPPCPAPPGPEIDRVPPSTPHFPCPGDHWHYYVYNQNPVTCQCFGPRRMFGGCCGIGVPGAPC
ncbi:eCIS core domain-containing protein [Sorangium sp. So ce145]|uniref:eCIS core domain-containing protein n=1 Tax=Sorangium sp. So ce145 TaxID=3133285 RepID=UPI003F5F1C18